MYYTVWLRLGRLSVYIVYVTYLYVCLYRVLLLNGRPAESSIEMPVLTVLLLLRQFIMPPFMIATAERMPGMGCVYRTD